MARKYSYDYPMTSNTADVCLFGVDQSENDVTQRLKVLLVGRGQKEEAEYKKYALPGGFLEPPKDYDLKETAVRELREETQVEFTYLEQFRTYSRIFRDPRQEKHGVRIITTVFIGLTDCVNMGQKEDGFETDKVEWVSVNKVNDIELAFDHNDIITDAYEELQDNIWRKPLALNFLGSKPFTLTELQKIFEAIEGESLDKANFRKYLISDKRRFKLESTDKKSETTNRPATLYHITNKERKPFSE